MAFAQPQRRPRHRTQHSATVSEDDSLLVHLSPVLSSNSSPTTATAGVLSNGLSPVFTASTVSASDSETDWHVISAASRPPYSTNRATMNTPSQPSQSPTTVLRNVHPSFDRQDSLLSMESSEQESFSSFRPSDTESCSDIDFAFDALPSHDGTGTFMDAELDQTSEEEMIQQCPSSSLVPQSLSSATGYRLNTTRLSSSFRDFEPNSPSMPNILLPNGGIHLPSFATNSNCEKQESSTTTNTSLKTSPNFQPTVTTKDMISSLDEPTRSRHEGSVDSEKSFDDQIAFTRKKKRPRNLDRIPTHHPSLPGSITSLAILSAIWNNLRRLTDHLIENDTCTADTFTSLVSEASLEGCLPFGSHLHMELATGLRKDYTNQ